MPVYIEAPAFRKAHGGLVAVADIRDSESPHVAIDGAHYLSEECAGPARAYDATVCTPPETRPGKVFDPINIVSGEPFTIYKGVECQDMADDNLQWARNALAGGEDYAIESGFMQQSLAVATTTDIGGGDTFSLINGIAMLEGYASTVYGGVAILHASRSVTTRALANRAFQSDSSFNVTTRQGNLVANGGGYEINLGPDGLAPAAGQAWLYITGPVTLIRSPITATTAADYTHNTQQAIAERVITPVIQCFVAAVRVTLEVSDV